MFSNTFTQINKPHFVVYIFEVKLSLIFRRIMSRKSEIGKKVLKLQRDFKEEKRSNSKEGMMEFESIGLHHLKETSSAVQEKQITSYKRNASKIDDETVLLYNLP
ncbi:unnamed protein product [Rhizophagus irregularis]|nr:unnamed protein product [Rhizophagus irregularis]